MTDAVRTEVHGTTLLVTLDRPKANAIDQATSRRMGEVFAAFRDDPALRCAVLTGGGEKFFSAGWDLNEAAAIGDEGYSGDYGQGGLYGFPELPGLDKPVIAAVGGLAVGGGFEVCLLADMVIAADDARFWLPEASLGLVPDVASFVLPQRLPSVIAAEVLLAGRRLDAAEAERWGLVNAVVPRAGLIDAALALAERVGASGPLAVAAIRETARMARLMPLDECYNTMRAGGFPALARAIASDDAREGVAARAEGRAPVWRGR